jgi:hypothetical protein
MKLTKIWDLPMMMATLLCVVLLFASGAVLGVWDWYFAAGMDAFFIVLFATVCYLGSRGRRHPDNKIFDERAERNTIRAARNGFLASLVVIGALPMVVALLYGTGEMKTTLILQICATLLSLLVLTQALSYAYYTDKDLA